MSELEQLKKENEKLKKELARMKGHRDAHYDTEEWFFRIIKKRFNDENYEELWEAINNICCSCYVRNEIGEVSMERELNDIDVYDYFPEENQEAETEANYKKYMKGYGYDSD